MPAINSRSKKFGGVGASTGPKRTKATLDRTIETSNQWQPLTRMIEKPRYGDDQWQFSMEDMATTLLTNTTQAKEIKLPQDLDPEFIRTYDKLDEGDIVSRIQYASSTWKLYMKTIDNQHQNPKDDIQDLSLHSYTEKAIAIQLYLFLERLSNLTYAALYIAYLPFLLECCRPQIILPLLPPISKSMIADESIETLLETKDIPLPVITQECKTLVLYDRQRKQILSKGSQEIQIMEQDDDTKQIISKGDQSLNVKSPQEIQLMDQEDDEKMNQSIVGLHQNLLRLGVLFGIITRQTQIYAMQLLWQMEYNQMRLERSLQRNTHEIINEIRALKQGDTHNVARLTGVKDALVVENARLQRKIEELQEEVISTKNLADARANSVNRGLEFDQEIDRLKNELTQAQQREVTLIEWKEQATAHLQKLSTENENIRKQFMTAEQQTQTLIQEIENWKSHAKKNADTSLENEKILQRAEQRMNELQKDQLHMNQAQRQIQDLTSSLDTARLLHDQNMQALTIVQQQLSRWEPYAKAYEALIIRYGQQDFIRMIDEITQRLATTEAQIQQLRISQQAVDDLLKLHHLTNLGALEIFLSNRDAMDVAIVPSSSASVTPTQHRSRALQVLKQTNQEWNNQSQSMGSIRGPKQSYLVVDEIIETEKSIIQEVSVIAGNGGGGNDPPEDQLLLVMNHYVGMLEKAISILLQGILQTVTMPRMLVNQDTFMQSLMNASLSYTAFKGQGISLQLWTEMCKPIHTSITLDADRMYTSIYEWDVNIRKASQTNQSLYRIPSHARLLPTLMDYAGDALQATFLTLMASQYGRKLYELSLKQTGIQLKLQWRLLRKYISVAVMTWEWADQFRTEVPPLYTPPPTSTVIQSEFFDYRTPQELSKLIMNQYLELTEGEKPSMQLITIHQAMALIASPSTLTSIIRPLYEHHILDLPSTVMIPGTIDEKTEERMEEEKSLLEATADRYLDFLQSHLARKEYMTYHAQRESTVYTVDWRLDGSLMNCAEKSLKRTFGTIGNDLPDAFYRLCGQREQFLQQSIYTPLRLLCLKTPDGGRMIQKLDMTIQGSFENLYRQLLNTQVKSTITWKPDFLIQSTFLLLPMAVCDYIIIPLDTAKDVEYFIECLRKYITSIGMNNLSPDWIVHIYLRGPYSDRVRAELITLGPLPSTFILIDLSPDTYTWDDVKFLAYFYRCLIYMPELEQVCSNKNGSLIPSPQTLIQRIKDELKFAVQHTPTTMTIDKKPLDFAGDKYLGKSDPVWQSEHQSDISQWKNLRAHQVVSSSSSSVILQS